MKRHVRSIMLVGALAVGGMSWAATPARAQGFGYVGPRVSVGVGNFGYYGGYPVVAPAPVVVAPAPLLVPAPYYVGRPYYGARPYYGYRGYGYGGYRRYPPMF